MHEADKSSGKRTQRIDIYFNFIGNFNLPAELVTQKEEPKRTSKKKLRSEMTESQRQAERERDHRRYAERIAPRIAKEKAERAAILAGTSFENVDEAAAQ